MEWHYIINPNSASKESKQNWFLANNKSYGNLSYIYRLFGIFFFVGWLVIDGSTSWALYVDFEFISIITAASVTVSVTGLAAIFYMYLVKNTPYFDDIHQIHEECKIHSKLLLLWCMCCGTMNIAFIIFQDHYIWLLGATAMNLPLSVMVYISTYYLKSHQQEISITPRKKRCISNEVKIEEVLADNDLIHAFMVHLSKEYSMEILLSFIEMNQYQQHIAEQMKHEISDNINLFNFADNIPKSEIIRFQGKTDDIVMVIDTDGEDTFLDNAKIKAHKLFNKYIKQGSEFEINISSQERRKLSNLLHELDVLLSHNINLQELLLLFEPCKKQMKLLLQWSLTRFKTETEFCDNE